jgi:hypothetical protein
LPEQFQSLCENGNLRVAVIFFALSWLRFLREHAGKSAKHETNHQRDDDRTPHISTNNTKEAYHRSWEIFGNGQREVLSN